jgi:hypothetical protein
MPEAEDAFADAVAALRRRRRLPPAAVEPSLSLRDAACAMARRDDVEASLIPRQRGQRHVVGFTTFEPAELTGKVRDAALDPGLDRITFGICHRETRRYPSGVFWFAVSY